MAEISVSEPFPIFVVARKYLLYDINTITHVRSAHHITGVLIGGLPQAPQQNVFLGIPLELMPEEARLLVEKGVAYIVDDVKMHKKEFLASGLSAEEKKAFLRSVHKQGVEAGRKQQEAADDRKQSALKKIAEKGGKTENWNDIPDDMFAPRGGRGKSKPQSRGRLLAPLAVDNDEDQDGADDATLFGSPSIPASSVRASSLLAEEIMKITPTTSAPPLTYNPPPSDEALPLPEVGHSYHLFKHLHSKDYFLAPGLRFGCQYMAYPGDPLRFHSHFLCNGMGWDEEFDLLDLVGGGRLGTGVKKGFLIGGEEKIVKTEIIQNQDHTTRAFCIEWGGM